MADIQKVRPRSRAEIEEAAQSVLSRFHPEVLQQVLPFDVVRFFELDLFDDTGIETSCDDLPPGLDGCTDSLNKTSSISKTLYEHGENHVLRRRLRATIAHEIGHCYLHVPEAQQNRSYQNVFRNDSEHPFELYDPDDLNAYENPEWHAWAFASALLMPEPCFRLAVMRNRTKKQIKNGFDVNPSFVEVRLRELKIPKILRQG